MLLHVCRKNMFYNQTSLKGFSAFSTISLAFSIASAISAFLKPLLILFMITNRVEITTKKAVMKKQLQLLLKLISQNQSVTRRVISQNWSIKLTVLVMMMKKKAFALTLMLIN